MAGPAYWEHLANPDSIDSPSHTRQVALTILSSSRFPNIQNMSIGVKIDENSRKKKFDKQEGKSEQDIEYGAKGSK